MNRLIISTLLISLPLISIAKEHKTATQSCEAYNNMKHTTNTNEIKLKVGTEYRILDHKRGQILTLIKGERIAQRWVDEGCFGKQSLSSAVLQTVNTKSKELKKIKKTSRQNLLAISWQNAFCQTHQYKKECKRMTSRDFGASHFVLHGLWPQPRNNQYCKVDKKEIGKDKNKQWNRLKKLDLSSTTRERLSKLMPGYSSNLHKHEWIKHGTCYGTGASDYYDDAMDLMTQVNESKVQEFFEKNIGKKVALKDIRKIFDKEFGAGAGRHVTMNCTKGLITELWVHIGNGSDKLKDLLKTGETPKSRCHKGRIDAVGY
jgi:ribonuclease T2